MNGTEIHNYSDFIEYLKVKSLRCLSRRNRPLTLDAWAKKLGYQSPRTIAMVLKGQRLPSAELLQRFSHAFGHTEKEHRYLELLVRLERKKRNGEDPREALHQLKTLSKKSASHFILDSHQFSYIAEWYHFAIRQLIGTPTFKEDLFWIQKRLRMRITQAEIKKALDVLLQLQLISRNESGKLVLTQSSISTTEDIPDSAIRRHHFGMATQAIRALDSKDFENQEFTSITLRIDPKAMKIAKKRIREFRDAFHQEFENVNSNHVYQFNFQVFEHTTPMEGESYDRKS